MASLEPGDEVILPAFTYWSSAAAVLHQNAVPVFVDIDEQTYNMDPSLLEAAITPAVELVWSKRRILEVYLNVAEFDTGVFGIEAAALHHFGVLAADLTPRQAALLAAVLPNPKERQAVNPSTATQRRAAQIMDGAATIRRDGRADCFE